MTNRAKFPAQLHPIKERVKERKRSEEVKTPAKLEKSIWRGVFADFFLARNGVCRTLTPLCKKTVQFKEIIKRPKLAWLS